MHSRFWQFDFEDLFVIRGHDKLAFASILMYYFFSECVSSMSLSTFALCNKYKLKARNVTWDLFAILLRVCSQRVHSFVTKKLNVQDYWCICSRLRRAEKLSLCVRFRFFFWVENQHTVIGSYYHMICHDLNWLRETTRDVVSRIARYLCVKVNCIPSKLKHNFALWNMHG